MLSSSAEYIQALREEKYLLFLEWPYFIVQNYKEGVSHFDADSIINFLVYEWLTYGYCEDDAKKIAILFAVNDMESQPLKGKVAYTLTAIFIAVLLCMLYQKYGLSVPYISEHAITGLEIDQQMTGHVSQLGANIYNDSLLEMQALFFHWVENADKHQVEAAYQKIHNITKPRYLLEDYLLHLERTSINQDALYDTRVSIAERFLAYLYEQTELTPQVSAEIVAYVRAIREMQPTKSEEQRLDLISPPSALENTWRWVSGVGQGFFSLVLQEKSIGDFISGRPQNP